MKKLLFCLTWLILTCSCFSQETNAKQSLTKQDYLAKSKRQKTAGWIMLGGGAALVGVGIAIGSSEELSFDDAGTAAVLGGVGILSMIGSIPVFLAAGKNKRRANRMSGLIRMESSEIARGGSLHKIHYPAVSLTIDF